MTVDAPGSLRQRLVRLYYQSIPSYYLRDRFATASGPETQRLHEIASHLNVQATPIKDWKRKAASAAHPIGP